ncbi:MAG: FAD-dependent monooxygenase [Solirubrobacteraceae bacterium]
MGSGRTGERDDDAVHATEVCVVGAGPAGLALALVLGRAGIPCIVLERLSSEAFRRRAGAGLIEYRTVQLLDAEGLADPILDHGSTNGVCEFRCEGRSYALDYGALTGGRGQLHLRATPARSQLGGAAARRGRSAVVRDSRDRS